MLWLGARNPIGCSQRSRKHACDESERGGALATGPAMRALCVLAVARGELAVVMHSVGVLAVAVRALAVVMGVLEQIRVRAGRCSRWQNRACIRVCRGGLWRCESPPWWCDSPPWCKRLGVRVEEPSNHQRQTQLSGRLLVRRIRRFFVCIEVLMASSVDRLISPDDSKG